MNCSVFGSPFIHAISLPVKMPPNTLLNACTAFGFSNTSKTVLSGVKGSQYSSSESRTKVCLPPLTRTGASFGSTISASI